MQPPDRDTASLIADLAAFAPGDRAAIVARLPAYQRGHVDRSVALLAAGGGVPAAARFSAEVAAHVAAVTDARRGADTTGLTAATRASLLKALTTLDDHPVAGLPALVSTRPSLLGLVLATITGRRRR